MGRLMSKAKELAGIKKPVDRKAAYEASNPRTQALLSMLKSYAKEKKKKRTSRPKRNPMTTGTLGRFARSGR